MSFTSKQIKTVSVLPATSIREAAARMDSLHMGTVLVVDKRRQLLGTVTDGDLRRAMLARIDLDSPIRVLIERKKGTPFAKPVVARFGAPRESYIKIFRRHFVQHLPLIDAAGRVVGLAARNDYLTDDTIPVQAVLMAGGKGKRLFPLTKNTPKPMLPIGDKPILEIIIDQLRDAGVSQMHLATHHQREQISHHFRDGKKFGVNLSYLPENKPLGTAGALATIDCAHDTLLVMNGDLLTRLNFRAMLKYHREMKAELTAAVCQYDLDIPYGVVDCKGSVVTGITEKPRMSLFVCAGIYLVEPSALKLIPKRRRSDMTDLVARLVAKKRRVASFPIREYWLDVGRPNDYIRAQKDAASWRAPMAAQDPPYRAAGSDPGT
jgi:dTDP-glucose pyrophosphorylase/CBS domain-containing protein